jgi:hypothetical protein
VETNIFSFTPHFLKLSPLSFIEPMSQIINIQKYLILTDLEYGFFTAVVKPSTMRDSELLSGQVF